MCKGVKGANCVIWSKSVDTFPYVGGVGGIVLSWFISPVFSAIIASGIYLINRFFVLRKPFNYKRLTIMYPCLVGFTLIINSFFIIYKGAKGLGVNKIELGEAFAISFGIGTAGALITAPFIPKLCKYVENKFTTTSSIEMSTTFENNRSEYNINSDKELSTVVNIHNRA